MKITLNVPDGIFQEFIEKCESKSDAKFDNVKKLIENIQEYYIKTEPTEKDTPLYKWLAALVFDDLINVVHNRKSN